MTCSVPRTSTIAFGVAALVSLSALSAARGLSFRARPDAKHDRASASDERVDPRAYDNRSRAITERACADSSLGRIGTSQDDSDSELLDAPFCSPSLCVPQSAPQRQSCRDSRDGSGRRRRRSGIGRRLSILLLSQLRLLFGPRAVSVLRAHPSSHESFRRSQTA
jgi:hypothetical protein